jgi:hypothetical protein
MGSCFHVPSGPCTHSIFGLIGVSAVTTRNESRGAVPRTAISSLGAGRETGLAEFGVPAGICHGAMPEYLFRRSGYEIGTA